MRIVVVRWFLMTCPLMIAAVLSVRASAQSAGNNTVYNGASTVGSTAYIDASVYPPASSGYSADICSAIHYVLANASTLAPSGGVIDARTFAKWNANSITLDCSRSATSFPNPFSGIGAVPGFAILLPPGNIYISSTWTIPANTRLIGEGSFGTTAIYWNFPGSPSSGFVLQLCPSGACQNASIEHLTLGINTAVTASGIENVNAGDGSYIDDVTMVSMINGLKVDSGAAGSGPYTNLNITLKTGGSSCSLTNGASCQSGIELDAPTRGVHGATIIGDLGLSGGLNNGSCSPTREGVVPGAVLVRAGGNTVEDVHVEAVWDAVQIEPPLPVGTQGANVQGVWLSNITGGQKAIMNQQGNSVGAPVTNVLHICGAPLSSNAKGTLGYCSTYNYSGSGTLGTVSDVTAWNISSDLDGAGAAGAQACNAGGYASSVLDEVQGTVISYATAIGALPARSMVGSYHLGEALSVGGSIVATPTLPGIVVPASTDGNLGYNGLPGWIVGNGVPSGSCIAGTLYSNTGATGSGSALYSCIGSTWSSVTLGTYP